MDVLARLEALQIERDRLLERVALLEEQLVGRDDLILPPEWGLTTSEMRVFRVLLNRTMATKEAIHATLYHNEGKEAAEPKIVDVFICKIRKKLKPYGIEVKTIWGQGYSLDPETRARLKKELLPQAA